MFLAGDEWQAKFRDFQTEAWRLETRPEGERFSGPYEDKWTARRPCFGSGCSASLRIVMISAKELALAAG